METSDAAGARAGDWVADCETIRQTISLYCQLLDDQRYDELGRLFAVDAQLYWEGKTMVGRAGIVNDLPSTQMPFGLARHLPYGPVIRLDGDEAAAWTDVMVTVHPPDASACPGWVGRYHQRFVRVDGSWRISRHIALGIGEALPEGVEPVDSRALGD